MFSVPYASIYLSIKWDVDRYQQQHSFVWKFGADSLLEEIISDIRVGDVILDVGCGSGELTDEVRRRATEKIIDIVSRSKDVETYPLGKNLLTVMGMDSSAEMIATASKQHRHVHFFQGDVCNFSLPPPPYVAAPNDDTTTFDDDDTVDDTMETHGTVNISDDETVDDTTKTTIIIDIDDFVDDTTEEYATIIISNAALHWIPPPHSDNVDQAVACISRALAPGGRLVVEFGGQGNVEKITQAAQHVREQLYQQQRKEQGYGDDEDDSPAGAYGNSRGSGHNWYFPSISEFTAALEKHGIEVTSATLFDRPTPLEDGMHGMSNWLRMFGSHLLSVEEHQDNGDNNVSSTSTTNPVDREQVIRQIHDELMRRGELWNGEQWIADYRRIRVIGKKK
jgi:trans-aconitate methyltransferase